MRNTRLVEGDLGQVLLGGFNPFANGLRDFLRLACTIADHRGGRISDHDQRGKGHVLAAFDDLRHAIDGDHLVFQLVASGVDLLLYSCCRHSLDSSELRASSCEPVALLPSLTALAARRSRLAAKTAILLRVPRRPGPSRARDNGIRRDRKPRFGHPSPWRARRACAPPL